MDITAFGSTILSTIVFLPLLGAISMSFVPRGNDGLARNIALLFSALAFFVSLFLLQHFDSSTASMQFVEHYPWIPSIGASYVVGIDGLSIWLVVLTTFLSMLVFLASNSVTKKVRAYLAALLLLEVGMLGTFLSLDALTFYVFWELMLIPMYFLIGVWGGKRRVYAALKFVLYTALGSLLMLVAIVYLAYQCHEQLDTFSFLIRDWMELKLTMQEELFLFGAFALAFSIKVPVFPLHTWLPDAHVEAPTGGSVILAGVLLKMGLYGLIRFGMPIFPYATQTFAPYFAVLGVIGIVYGALVAWVQTDIKKLVAYSSVSHLGFCVLGYATLNIYGLQGSVMQMLNHGISTAALFLLVGVLYDRKHTREIEHYGGLGAKLPVFSFVYLVFTLSSIGLPLTNGFVGEFLILLGSFQYHRLLAAIAVSGVILGALYMLSLYRRVIFGELDEERNGDLEDLTLREKVIFAPLLIMVFFMGIFPNVFLSKMEVTSKELLTHVNRYAPSDIKKTPVAIQKQRFVMREISSR